MAEIKVCDICKCSIPKDGLFGMNRYKVKMCKITLFGSNEYDICESCGMRMIDYIRNKIKEGETNAADN